MAAPRFETVEPTAGKRLIVSRSEGPFIRTQQDFLDLLGRGMEEGTLLFLLDEKDFDPGFYDLKTGLAGAILQKAADYRARLAIVGGFTTVGSTRFRELMSESREGDLVRFAGSRTDAIAWLVR